MRVVVAPGSFGGSVDGPVAVEAIAAGWLRAAPTDELRLAPVNGAVTDASWLGLDAELELADLVVTGQESFDWQSLRDSLITAVAAAAAARGVPCLVLAGKVSVGRREAASIGVDTAYAMADARAGTDPAGDPAGALSALAQRVAARWSR